MAEKSESFQFHLDKLEYLVKRYYELDEVPRELLIQIEQRAENLKTAALYTRAALNFEEDEN